MAAPDPAQLPTPDELRSRAFWAALHPDLHIGDAAFCATARPVPLDPVTRTALAGQLIQEGYFQERIDLGLDLARMAAAVRALSARGVLPVFAFVYDEFWCAFRRLDDWYRAFLGDAYRGLPDFWVWNVDPANGDAGWKPHRDKGHDALLPDGGPMALTTWVPLSEATPLNGCLYMVPAHSDPTYGTDRDHQWMMEFPAVRALPAVPGDVLMWNSAVLHWGGRTSPRASESRVSMAFECQRGDVAPFNTPLLDPAAIGDFDTRLALIAKQILQYRHMYRMGRDMVAFARSVRDGGDGGR